MIRRKIEKKINDWIDDSKKALLVTGARQVGKTYIIRQCLKEKGCDYDEVNLISNPDYVKALEISNTIDDLKINLSALNNRTYEDQKTILFIDEVQEYKDVITKIKAWIDDGRIKFVLSGSLLGIELRNIRSAPVGYMDEIDMYPLDFEEFIKASGVTDETIEYLKGCFNNKLPVSEVINEKMFTYLQRYLVVGGMPEAVHEYLESGNMGQVFDIQENIVRQYKRDFTKYEADDKKLMLISIYDQIPSQLLKQNKRFNYADLKQGLRFERLENSFLWLKHSGVSLPVYNATEPRVSLNQNVKSSLLKLYSSDVGLLTSQYGNAMKSKILLRDNKVNLGGVYENFVAEELKSHGYDLYFYNSHSMGELDFVIEHNLQVVPIEVKSGKDYYVHSAISKVANNSEYEINEAYVFAHCNIEHKDKIIYFPIYMCGFLTEEISIPRLNALI